MLVFLAPLNNPPSIYIYIIHQVFPPLETLIKCLTNCCNCLAAAEQLLSYPTATRIRQELLLADSHPLPQLPSHTHTHTHLVALVTAQAINLLPIIMRCANTNDGPRFQGFGFSSSLDFDLGWAGLPWCIKQIMSCHNIDGSSDTSAKNTKRKPVIRAAFH